MFPDGKTRTKDKYRVVYTDHQRLELEKEFHYSKYITIRRKAELATALSLSERQVPETPPQTLGNHPETDLMVCPQEKMLLVSQSSPARTSPRLQLRSQRSHCGSASS